MGLQLEFRHDCQNLGCSNFNCNLCKLSQRRRCPTNFAAKYLAPCDVVEAKCGAQIYVVVTDEATGQLVQQGLDNLALLISIIDGRKFEVEGDSEDALEHCELLVNKQGQPLLAHGRSGSYTDTKRVVVPMIHGQALLPDLKITDSSEALLTGRAPPFRLSVRAVHRSGEKFEGVAYALSDPFVVATARVKGAAKLEIPHVEDHVSKIDCVGLQTQKKLEDIKAAAVAAGVPDLNLPINSVVRVGQFRDLVETAERNKALRETLKQVLRLTKGWDVARDHVRKAVETDVQLRVYHPDGRTEVGLVFKCGSFNVIDINRPVGLMRRKQNPSQANQELVDVIWLPLDTSSFPDAVKRMLPQASADWRKDAHPGWALLPLTTGHMPPYSEGGKPASQTSSFTFTVRMAAPPAAAAATATPPPGSSNGTGAASTAGSGMPQRSGTAAADGGMHVPLPPLPGNGGASTGGMNGFAATAAGGGGGGMNGFAPIASNGGGGLNLPGLNLPGLGGLGMPPPQQQQQQMPLGFVPGSGLHALQQQQHGLGALPGQVPQPGGLPADLMFPSQQHHQQQQQHAAAAQQQRQQQYGGLPGLPLSDLPASLAGLDASAMQGLMQMPTLHLFNSNGGGMGAGTGLGSSIAAAAAAAAGGQQQQRLALQQAAAAVAGAAQQRQAPLPPHMAQLHPELAHLMKEDSLSPFEDPNFQQLMSLVAANAAPGGHGHVRGADAQRGPAPLSGGSTGRGARDGGANKAKRKADTSLETWMDMHKNLDVDLSLPPSMPAVPPLESLFTSMLPGGDSGSGEPGPGGAGGCALPPQPVGFFPALPNSITSADASGGGGDGGGVAATAAPPRSPKQQSPRAADAAEAAAAGSQAPKHREQQQQQEVQLSGAPQPMEVQQPSEASTLGQQQRQEQVTGTASSPPPQQQGAAAPPPPAASGAPQPAAAAGSGAPPLVTAVTLEQMQHQFARVMRQEITFGELEAYLKQYNLLPSGQPIPGTGSAAAAAGGQQQPGAADGGIQQRDRGDSGGLEDMQTIEMALPALAQAKLRGGG